ncbi:MULTISPECIES: hypothetical protein [Bacteroides]
METIDVLRERMHQTREVIIRIIIPQHKCQLFPLERQQIPADFISF